MGREFHREAGVCLTILPGDVVPSCLARGRAPRGGESPECSSRQTWRKPHPAPPPIVRTASNAVRSRAAGWPPAWPWPRDSSSAPARSRSGTGRSPRTVPPPRRDETGISAISKSNTGWSSNGCATGRALRTVEAAAAAGLAAAWLAGLLSCRAGIDRTVWIGRLDQAPLIGSPDRTAVLDGRRSVAACGFVRGTVAHRHPT